MINIYFFPTSQNHLPHDARYALRGATVWESKLDEKYYAVVTQTGKPTPCIYIECHDYEIIRKSIAINHSELASNLMRKLVDKWTKNEILHVLPYAKDGVSFVTVTTLDHGSRYDGQSHMIMLQVKIENPSIYVDWLRQNGARILDPNTVLFCDVGLGYEPNTFRGCKPYYLDYSTASINDKMSFMQEIYHHDEYWGTRDDKEYNEYSTKSNKMVFYNYSKEQARILLYSGSNMTMIKNYTIDEINAILEMRAVDTDPRAGSPTKLTIEEGREVYNKRVALDSTEGGFKDLIYPVHAIERMMRLAIVGRRDGETERHHVLISDWTIDKYLKAKDAYVEVKDQTSDPLSTIAKLVDCQPAILKSYFKNTTDVEWSVELEEVISVANQDDVTVTTLEIL